MRLKKVLATMAICTIIGTSPIGAFESNASAGAGKILSDSINDNEKGEGRNVAGVSALLSDALSEETAADIIKRKKDEEEHRRIADEQQKRLQEEAARRQQEFETKLLDFQDTLKTRNDTVIAISNDVGPRYGIKPTLIQAIIWYESTNYQYAENSGCYGYMQVNPKWHYDKMEYHQVYDIYDQYGNILIGTWTLAELLEKNGGNLPLSLMQYNGDSRADYLNSIGEMSDYARKIINLDYRLTLLEELYAEYQ